MAKFGMQFFKPTEKFNGNWSVLEHKSREWKRCIVNDGVMTKSFVRHMASTVRGHARGRCL